MAIPVLIAAIVGGAGGTKALNQALDGAGTTVGDVAVSPGTATASVTVATSGLITFSGSSDPGDKTYLFYGSSSDYEVFATVTAGSVSSGTTGSWLALSSARTWTKSTTGTLTSCTIELEIREVANPSNSITYQVVMNAEVVVA